MHILSDIKTFLRPTKKAIFKDNFFENTRTFTLFYISFVFFCISSYLK